MTQFTTELLNFLAQKQDIDEFFRSSLEIAMNDLLQVELSAFLGYEPYEKEGYNTGNSRNGTYSRQFETKYGLVNLIIPRDRNGEFSPVLLPSYARRDDHWEEMVIKLYQTGVTTREISDIIERMYGHHLFLSGSLVIKRSWHHLKRRKISLLSINSHITFGLAFTLQT